jgi:hypothetical protein
LANIPFDTRLACESTEAFYAFSIYRDMGLKRNLDEVSRRFDAEKRGSGLRLVSAKEVRTKHRKSGKIGLWSRKFQWVERAAAWDRTVDQRLREKQLDEIERMAKRQAQEAQVLTQVLMAPVVAFASGLKDPNRARTLENADMNQLLQMSLESAKAIPRVHKAERLARGFRCVPVSTSLNYLRGRSKDAHHRTRNVQRRAKSCADCRRKRTPQIELRSAGLAGFEVTPPHFA